MGIGVSPDSNYILIFDRQVAASDPDFPVSLRLMMEKYPADRFFIVFHGAGDFQTPVLHGWDEPLLLRSLTSICQQLMQREVRWDFYFACSADLMGSIRQIMTEHGAERLHDTDGPRKDLH